MCNVRINGCYSNSLYRTHIHTRMEYMNVFPSFIRPYTHICVVACIKFCLWVEKLFYKYLYEYMMMCIWTCEGTVPTFSTADKLVLIASKFVATCNDSPANGSYIYIYLHRTRSKDWAVGATHTETSSNMYAKVQNYINSTSN